MAELYNGSNKKMMIHDPFSSSDKNISYMNNPLKSNHEASEAEPTMPRTLSIGKKYPLSTFILAKPIIHCALLIIACLIAPICSYAQSGKFSNKDCYTIETLTPTTNWQTYDDSYLAGEDYDRYDVYLTVGGTYIFSLCSDDGGSAEFDSYIALHGYGSGCDDGGHYLDYNDDYCDTESKIEYTATSTGWVSLYITGYDADAEGDYALRYKYVMPPSNATCATAATLSCGTENLSGSTIGTSDVNHGTGYYISNFGVWYTFTGNGGETTITSVATFDHKMVIVSGSCGNFTDVDEIDGYIEGYPETYTFTTQNGVTYYVYIAYYDEDGTSSETGTFTISRTCVSNYTVSVSANPSAGGTVSGGGSFSSGSSCTVTATANSGYTFVNWTEGGSQVSTSASYTISNISADHTLVANFEAISSGGGCEEVTMGTDNSTNSYLPSYNYYKYSLTQQIYTSSEIGQSGTINSISFYNAGAEKSRKYDIYLKATTKSSFSSKTDWITVSASDKVYSQPNETTTTMTANGWTTITFDTPFEYDGTSNLVVIIDDNTGSWSNSPHMACNVYDASSMALYAYDDDTDYDPLSPPTTEQSYNNVLSVKNQIKFCIVPAVSVPDDFCVDFESGSMPDGWTSEGSASWSVGTGDYSSNTGANTGSYNAKITHGTSGDATYLVSPEMDLSNVSSASVTFSYVNRSWLGDIDEFAVCYRVNGGAWTELFSTDEAHSSWTEQSVTLEGFAANYQIGFKFTDHYGYGVGLDDICFTFGGGSAPTYSVPVCFDFAGENTTDQNGVDSGLPAGWDRVYPGSNTGYAPSIHNGSTISCVGSDESLLLCSGDDNEYRGPSIAIMPVLTGITTGVSISFDYRYNTVNQNSGTLEFGYMRGGTFTSLQSLTPNTSCVSSTYTMTSDLPSGARLAFRYNQTNHSMWFWAAVDNICINPPCGTIVYYDDFGGNNVQDDRYANPTLLASASPEHNYTSGGGIIPNTWTNAGDFTHCNYLAGYQWTSSWEYGDCRQHGESACTSAYPNVYAINKNTYHDASGNGWISNVSDHTFPGDVTRGYMLQGDGTGVFYQTTLNNVPAGDYTFSAWFMSVGSSATCSLSVSGNATATTGFVSITASQGVWEQKSCDFTLNATGNITITLQANGDFAVDDVLVASRNNAPPTASISLDFDCSNYPNVGYSTNPNGSTFNNSSNPYTYTVQNANGCEYTATANATWGNYHIYYYDKFNCDGTDHVIEETHPMGPCSNYTIRAASECSGSCFKKWATSANGGGTAYMPGDVITPTSNLRLFAIYDNCQTCSTIDVDGSGTSQNENFPSYSATNYSLTQQIYTPCEIGKQGTIKSISFYNSGSTKNRIYDVFIKQTNINSYGSPASFIPVASTDRVTYTNVTMSASGWTTIYFLTPFEYDGTSNLVVTIDDNTGTASSGMRCYTYSTSPVVQAVYATSASDINPANLPAAVTSYYKNRIKFGICDQATLPSVNIQASADPVDGGTITGTGSIAMCSTATLTATPNNGYTFVNWTEDDVEVSTDATYSFTVTGARALVAHFESSCSDVEIGVGGTTTNVYLPSYSFYNYSLTQQIYTPCEIGTAGNIKSISFYNGGSAKTRTYDIYLKQTDKNVFSGSTDWITVVAGDKVVSSRSVTMAAGSWTTIIFDTPFVYDGTSNLAVIMDDNTGSYSSGMSCRVYDATGQSLRIYSDGINYVATAPTSYTGTILNVKNQLIFNVCSQSALPSANYNISVSASPSGAGTVSGGGNLGICSVATLTATPATCNRFVNWTENGAVVSTSSTYTFNVSASRTLVANFEEWTLSVTPASTTCRTWGSSVTLTASATAPSTPTYSWSCTSGTSGTASANTYTVAPTELSNSYKVSATYDGCTKELSKTITMKPSLTASISSSEICQGESVQLSATSNADITWSNSLGTSSPIQVYPENTTTYSVTAQSSDGCSQSSSFMVYVNPSPEVSVSSNPASMSCIAYGSEVNLTPEDNSDYMKYALVVESGSYSSISGTEVISEEDDGLYVLDLPFTFNYNGDNYTQITISTNGYVMMGETDVSIYNNELEEYENVLAGFWDDLYGMDISYSVLGSSPSRTLVVQYHVFTLDDYDEDYAFYFQIKLHETTNVIEYCYGNDMDNIVSASASIGLDSDDGFISATPASVSSANVSYSRVNNEVNEIDYLPAGTIYRFTPVETVNSYSWVASGTAGAAESNGRYTVSPITASTYTVTATDVNTGCYSTLEKQVTVVPNAGITNNTGVTQIDCVHESISLTATGEGTYQWNNGLGSNATPSAIVNAGTYTVTVTASGDCEAESSIELTKDITQPTVNMTGNNVICLGESTTLATTENANYSYSWMDGTATYNNVVSPQATTTYTVDVTDNTNGCYATGERIVTVNTPPSSLSSYDYIWRGVTSSNWNAVTNWFVYDSENERYSVASSMPGTPKNYYMGSGDCLSPSYWPSLNVDATVNNVTIASGSLTIPSGRTLSIAGSVAGPLNALENSTIVLCGANTQTLSDAATFYNVTFAQTTDGKKINVPNGITVETSATFTKGVVVGPMTFESGATMSGTVTKLCHVDGKVTKKGNCTFAFPTGSNGVLGTFAATIANSPATGVSVRFNNASASGGFSQGAPDYYPRWWNVADNCSGNDPQFDHVSNVECWKLEGVTGNTSLSGITVVVDADEATAHFHDNETSMVDENISVAAHYNCWKNIGGSTEIENSGKKITVSGVSLQATREPFDGTVTLGSKDHETWLPIEHLSFSATCNGRYAELAWSTATERNNDYFVIERSDDAINFTEIGRVAGAGNSIEQLDYTYNDYGIHGDDNYYRLVQVDYDGTRTASEIIVAHCIEPEVGEPDVQAYPNPFNSELTLVLDNFDNRAATIEVYDMLGKIIYTDKIATPQNSYETILNLSNLPSAAYNIRVSTTDFVINRNVVKN